jgi:hypothetical protein
MPWYVDWAPTPSNGQLGVVYIGPNSKIAIGEKLLLSAAHQIVRWCTGEFGGAPDSALFTVRCT